MHTVDPGAEQEPEVVDAREIVITGHFAPEGAADDFLREACGIIGLVQHNGPGAVPAAGKFLIHDTQNIELVRVPHKARCHAYVRGDVFGKPVGVMQAYSVEHGTGHIGLLREESVFFDEEGAELAMVHGIPVAERTEEAVLLEAPQIVVLGGQEAGAGHGRGKILASRNLAGCLGHKLGVFDVGTLNDTIARGRMNDLILMQEALQEKKIGDIAEQIYESGRKLIMIAGPSSSGKTTFSHRLSIQLGALGMKPHPIAVDNYFVNRVDSPRDENGNYDYEALNCIDVKQFNEDMEELLAGKRVELPVYNFVKGEREYKGDFLQLGAEDILVIEGIHCLNDDLSYSLPRDKKFKIYISALTQLNIDDHNRVPTTDGRLIRRMVRDARTRGASAQDTIRMWDSVRRGEERNIFPYQEEADAMFNSAFLYELSVLKQYAEPILYSVPRDSAEYNEAKRLLKFLDYFLGVSSEQVPHNSIVREFIGGSCFKV